MDSIILHPDFSSVTTIFSSNINGDYAVSSKSSTSFNEYSVTWGTLSSLLNVNTSSSVSIDSQIATPYYYNFYE